jgi:hypothetical protein
MGDQLQIDGLPAKFGKPNFYQVTGIEHSLDGMSWITDIKTRLRIVGKDTSLQEEKKT